MSVRMWGDERFRRLSRDAKFLWLYLLTGPHTTALPGLFELGKAQLAEALDFAPETLGSLFQEIAAQGMAKADWSARVVWLPKAARHNPPDNPNVVIGWLKPLKVIPECALKREAIAALVEFLRAHRGENYAAPFQPQPLASEPFGEPLSERSAEPLPKQEQEQDQDQDLKLSCPPGGDPQVWADLLPQQRGTYLDWLRESERADAEAIRRWKGGDNPHEPSLCQGEC